MDSQNFALIEMLGFAVVALGLGLWQYRSVSRELEKTRSDEIAAEEARKDDPPQT